MSFRKTYDEILELIKNKLLEVKIARAIVRKSGVRPGASGSGGGGGDGSENLFRGGDPFDAIVKLSATDYDVGWRKNGLGPVSTFNSGPPCNLRLFSFTRLRDSLLRSGTSNSGRFGYAFDRHVQKTATVSGGGTARWYERSWVGTSRQSFDSQDYADRILDVAKDQARVIYYITKADFDYVITLNLDPAHTGGSHTITGASGETGRKVSDWFDIPHLAVHDPAATVTIDLASDAPAVSVPTSYAELREGAGPIGCPFLELEVRTKYVPERSYWIQDEFTPEEYRIAQWELEV